MDQQYQRTLEFAFLYGVAVGSEAYREGLLKHVAHATEALSLALFKGGKADDVLDRPSLDPLQGNLQDRPSDVQRLSERELASSPAPSDQEPPELTHLQKAIESSRRILELEDDFDDEGSPVYSEQVWKRAVEFLANHARWLWETYGGVIDAPSILPGPAGSIDIHWDDPSYELLINFPADPHAMAGFYGDDRGEISIKGKFDPSTFNHGLLLWLKKAT